MFKALVNAFKGRPCPHCGEGRMKRTLEPEVRRCDACGGWTFPKDERRVRKLARQWKRSCPDCRKGTHHAEASHG